MGGSVQKTTQITMGCVRVCVRNVRLRVEPDRLTTWYIPFPVLHRSPRVKNERYWRNYRLGRSEYGFSRWKEKVTIACPSDTIRYPCVAGRVCGHRD